MEKCSEQTGADSLARLTEVNGIAERTGVYESVFFVWGRFHEIGGRG